MSAIISYVKINNKHKLESMHIKYPIENYTPALDNAL